MCGIAGWLSHDIAPTDAKQLIQSMTSAIRHRGPDSGRSWIDEAAGVALGFRRLAILDLSPAGEQPMISDNGRYVILFNGEIYNHADIRSELEQSGRAPASWRGHSDTEVLLAAVSAFGFSRALQQANGMFAVALWDREERLLSLARDRFGEKPLYYGWCRNTFLFGSELKAFATYPHWDPTIDRSSLEQLMRYRYIPAPGCIFENTFKLLPGAIATVDWSNPREARKSLSLSVYWDTLAEIENAKRDAPDLSENEAIDELERQFSRAVKLRMAADVPLGAFLSGGFDSTATVAMMQRQSSRPVRTFTIGFTEASYNEASYASQVARHLRTEHTELYVSPSDAMEVIPTLPTMYDEPFADSSQIPTYLVSRLARDSVTVALSGDGGDELFGGYNRHVIYDRVQQAASLIPRHIRQGASAALLSVSPERWDRIYNLIRFGRRRRFVGDHVHKLASILPCDVGLDGYEVLISTGLSNLVVGCPPNQRTVSSSASLPAGLTSPEKLMYLDLVNYLPDDILTKVDRASMAVSLEARLPFLDPNLMKFAWKLPPAYKVRNGIGKRIVRDMVYRHVPRSIMDRPKAGFGIPVDIWLRGPLRDWANALLDPAKLRADGYLRDATVSECWHQHQSGQRNRVAQLWPILMFQSWLNVFKEHHSKLAGL